jgi:hypothetical protein
MEIMDDFGLVGLTDMSDGQRARLIWNCSRSAGDIGPYCWFNRTSNHHANVSTTIDLKLM